jgi:hypothetical protein
MKRISVFLLLVAVALSGCAMKDKSPRLADDEGFNPDLVLPPRPTFPNVFVLNGHLVVDQEPIRIWRRDVGGDGRVVIAWALSAKSSTKWPAVAKAVAFKPEPARLSCEVRGAQAKVLACSFPYESHAKYKYTLTAQDGNTLLPPLDPYIVNME